MSPKEKKQELLHKFIPLVRRPRFGKKHQGLNYLAKEAAAICVDEIIEAIPQTICGYMPEGGTAMEIDNPAKHYWLQVKNELNKEV